MYSLKLHQDLQFKPKCGDSVKVGQEYVVPAGSHCGWLNTSDTQQLLHCGLLLGGFPPLLALLPVKFDKC